MTPSFPLRISDNRRHLVDSRGEPFFYLADTAWELFHRLDLEESKRYLEDRAAKGFNAIQAVALAELGGLRVPNANGDLPLENDDPARPNEAYFRHVDAVIEHAAGLGMVVALLPTWGDKWNKKWGAGPEIFTPDNAAAYGAFLGRRYRDQPVIWVLGGDRPIESDEHLAITRAMAEGVSRGDGARHLRTFHPNGAHSSSDWLNGEAWLDFHMAQTGHGSDVPCGRIIGKDYALEPTRPCLNGEPCYEDIPEHLSKEPGAPYVDEYGVRKAAYRSVFAGALGHTYGCNPIWQMWAPGREGVIQPRRPWWEAMGLPGSTQMGHLRRLIESRPMLERIPDQALIAEVAETDAEPARACRDEAGRFVMVYVSAAPAVTVDLSGLPTREWRGWVYDVCSGEATEVGTFAGGGSRTLQRPGGGDARDWVVVLDDAAAGFAAPGEGRR